MRYVHESVSLGIRQFEIGGPHEPQWHERGNRLPDPFSVAVAGRSSAVVPVRQPRRGRPERADPACVGRLPVRPRDDRPRVRNTRTARADKRASVLSRTGGTIGAPRLAPVALMSTDTLPTPAPTSEAPP